MYKRQAYEYAYNGRHLGYVKEKDTVLQITDLVQGALTEDRNLDVVRDAKDDITFKRVPVIGSSITPDSSDEVLKRLTYMGDVNVKAYGIYVNGKKMGAVENKDTAAAVLQDIKDRYTSDYEVSEIEEAVFIEKVEVKKSNTPLQDVVSEEAMVERLCTSGEKDSVHKVVVGETLADIAKLYSMTEEELLRDNEGVDPKKLEDVYKRQLHDPAVWQPVLQAWPPFFRPCSGSPGSPSGKPSAVCLPLCLSLSL